MPPDTVNRMPAFLVLGTVVDVTLELGELVGVVEPLLLELPLLVLLGVPLGVDALLADEAVDEEMEDEAEEAEELAELASQRQFQVSCSQWNRNSNKQLRCKHNITSKNVAQTSAHPVKSKPQSMLQNYRNDALIGAVPSSPWSQCFSRSYASVLPTSLGHIAPLTRGYSPRSPDAVIGTDRK
jgi:hypothetical protein